MLRLSKLMFPLSSSLRNQRYRRLVTNLKKTRYIPYKSSLPVTDQTLLYRIITVLKRNLNLQWLPSNVTLHVFPQNVSENLESRKLVFAVGFRVVIATTLSLSVTVVFGSVPFAVIRVTITLVTVTVTVTVHATVSVDVTVTVAVFVTITVTRNFGNKPSDFDF